LLQEIIYKLSITQQLVIPLYFVIFFPFVLRWVGTIDNGRKPGGHAAKCGEGRVKDDLIREKEKGLSLWYLWDVVFHRKRVGARFHTPEFGLAANLFALMSRNVLEKLGPDEGEALIRQAVEQFGFERGRRIAGRVSSLGKPLSFKNWLIYSDIDGCNFKARVSVNQGELVARVGYCSFMSAAREWGLEEYASRYCSYVDYAILRGYNPDIRLKLEPRNTTGKDFCLFRYGIKGS
jgi:hypothetical protein